MLDFLSITALCIAVTAVWVLAIRPSSKKPSHGTQKTLKLPIIGDLHSSPIEKPLLHWVAWSKAQGPVATAKLFGIVPVVVLNSFDAATELLSKRSAFYSNRPSSVSMEMITGSQPGRSRFTLMHDYDEHLKLHHRILSPSLGPVAAPRYQPVMELESRQLVRDLLDLARRQGNIVTDRDVYPFLERTQAGNILALHYGIRVPSIDEPIYHKVIEIQGKVTHVAANPGLPDLFPFLRHLPAVISPWKRAADALFAEQRDLYLYLLQQGDANPGWNATKQARALTAKYAKETIPEMDLAFTLATSVQGGMETSPRSLLWLFVAAISANKTFLSRAHAIMDATVGRDRLPLFSDRPSLAYVDAIVSEMMRWRPISPGSIPRRADKQDDYKGTRIVKNATVFANSYMIGRDTEVFDPELGEVEDFIPERWLKDCKMDSGDVSGDGELKTTLPVPVFGQGRRICLGKRVALDGSFMQVATMIWAFYFEPLGEEDPVDPDEMEIVGFMAVPKEFKFKLKPRGPWVKEVLEREWAGMEKDLDKIMGSAADVEV